MVRHAWVLLCLGLLARAGWANTYKVTTNADTGTGSLRWAIREANRHAGADSIVFAAGMKGRLMTPDTPLPAVTDAETTIDGDINGDGQPDVQIDGMLGSQEAGLGIKADHCTISGLAITGCKNPAIFIVDASYCTVRSCHIGVNLPGTAAVVNVLNIVLYRATHCTIGGTDPLQRNIIGCFSGGEAPGGVFLMDSAYNTVVGNYIGLTRSGSAALGTGPAGVNIYGFSGGSIGNRIGGTRSGSRNVIAGVKDGVLICGIGISSNIIAGNTFGLAADGKTVIPVDEAGVRLGAGNEPLATVTHNTIGGTEPAAANAFAGTPVGVLVEGQATVGNLIEGNYFGSNRARSATEPLHTGVQLLPTAGAQTIGGPSAKYGNYFTPNQPPGIFTFGVGLQGGADTLVRFNTFGLLPKMSTTVEMTCGVVIIGVSPRILDNTFYIPKAAVNIAGAGANPGIYRNTFRSCGTGVYIGSDATCGMGDLGDADTSNDGGNVFRLPFFIPPGTFYVQNYSPTLIKAEGNDFGTTDHVSIEKRLWDQKDDPTLGLVDYDPLKGGIHPTGLQPGALAVTTATAVATGSGAEVVFGLSAPAKVTVQILNLAGRLVATPALDRASTAGTQRVVWSGQADCGTRAPSGRYLVRVTARDDAGGQAQSLCSLTWGR